MVEPVGVRRLDAGGDALERDGELREVALRQGPFEEPSQRLDRVDAGPGAGQVAEPGDEGAAEDAALVDVGPHRPQVLDPGGPRVRRDRDAVDGADRGADDQVRHDRRLDERPQHADLGRAQLAAPAEHERHTVAHPGDGPTRR